MLVVDANVVAYTLVEGEKTAQARRLWARDREWTAPRLVLYELASVFAQLVKQQALSLADAAAGYESAISLVVPAEEPHGRRVLAIAVGLGLSAYDAYYLATAESLGVPLVTEDARLLRAAPEITRSLVSACA
jgi:predicted nucleic acid-binding protein